MEKSEGKSGDRYWLEAPVYGPHLLWTCGPQPRRSGLPGAARRTYPKNNNQKFGMDSPSHNGYYFYSNLERKREWRG